ncbi:MAG: hypothetical protein EAZ97_10930 [Bacteroidetes bacterium]|nr:MAG: hypothetical protein EAZ97_10930 [Bacteroidota bacterium]
MKFIYFLLFIFALYSCASSGKKALQQGDYVKASKQAIEKLRNSPSHSEAQGILQQAYPLALEYLLANIQHAKASKMRFSWEKVVNSYEQINDLYEDIRRSPAALSLVKPKFYVDQLVDAKQEAASERYNAGIQVFELKTRKTAQEAYLHFERAEQLFPDFKDSKKKMQESMEMATLKVLLSPVNSYQNNDLSFMNFQKELWDYCSNQRNMPKFVRFYNVQTQNQTFDQTLKIDLSMFEVGQPYLQANTDKLASLDSVKVGEVTLNGKKIDVKNKVYAEFNSFNKKITAKTRIALQIIDYKQNTVLMQENVDSEYIWQNEWASFNGDERALSPTQKSKTQKREEPNPSRQEMFNQTTNSARYKITDFIAKFYKNY